MEIEAVNNEYIGDPKILNEKYEIYVKHLHKKY